MKKVVKQAEKKPELFGLQYLEEVEETETELRGCFGPTNCIDDMPPKME